LIYAKACGLAMLQIIRDSGKKFRAESMFASMLAAARQSQVGFLTFSRGAGKIV
jgi:nucleoid-associated protein YejK